MKPSYEVNINSFGETYVIARFENRNLIIPADPSNSDYAEYLRYTDWVEAGNDPDEFWTRHDSEASE